MAPKLAGRSALTVLIQGTGAALAFATAVFLARLLEPVGYGIYATAMAVVTLVVVPTKMGLPTLVVREIAKYSATSDWDSVKGILYRAGQLLLVVGVAAAALVALVVALLHESLPGQLLDTLLWGAVLVPLMALVSLSGAALRGFHRIFRGQLAELVARPLLLLLLLATAISVAAPAAINASTAMSLHVLAAALAVVTGLVMLVSVLPRHLRRARPSYADSAQWRKSLLPLSLLAGLQVINSQADILMLGLLTTAEDVGAYRVAVQCASIVSMVLFAIGHVVEPSISRLYTLGDRQQLQDMIVRSGRLAFGFAALLTLAAFIFGRPLVEIVFGAAYKEAYEPLLILCCGQVAVAFSGWAVLLLNMTGNERTTARVSAFAAGGNLLANLLLIPRFGTLGAAFATALTLLIWKLLLARAALQLTGIRSVISFRQLRQ